MTDSRPTSCAPTPSSSSPTSSPRWPRPTTARGRRAGGSRRGRSRPTCWAATLADGFAITPKYIGKRRLIEIAIATLATDRALLLLGVPGTAKSWVGEHLAAAIAGDSTLLVQGTAGTARSRSATAGTTPGCWPRARPGRRWCPAR